MEKQPRTKEQAEALNALQASPHAEGATCTNCKEPIRNDGDYCGCPRGPSYAEGEWEKEAVRAFEAVASSAALRDEAWHKDAQSMWLGFVAAQRASAVKEVVEKIQTSGAVVFSGLKEDGGKLYAEIEIRDGSKEAFLISANVLASLEQEMK